MDSWQRSVYEGCKVIHLEIQCLVHIVNFCKSSFLDQPIQEVEIPHTHAAGKDGSVISIYTRFPPNMAANSRVPCVINIFGLDAYRTEILDRSELLIKRGWAIIGVEIPGTGDSPAEKNDPKSPDRVWSSLLDWVENQPNLDLVNIAAWGISTGG
jgi:dipeptidyl aminopeptidase/acylaminoacyl peptidase